MCSLAPFLCAHKTLVEKETLKKKPTPRKKQMYKVFLVKPRQESNSGPDYQNVFTGGFIVIRWL